MKKNDHNDIEEETSSSSKIMADGKPLNPSNDIVTENSDSGFQTEKAGSLEKTTLNPSLKSTISLEQDRVNGNMLAKKSYDSLLSRMLHPKLMRGKTRGKAFSIENETLEKQSKPSTGLNNEMMQETKNDKPGLSALQEQKRSFLVKALRQVQLQIQGVESTLNATLGIDRLSKADEDLVGELWSFLLEELPRRREDFDRGSFMQWYEMRTLHLLQDVGQLNQGVLEHLKVLLEQMSKAHEALLVASEQLEVLCEDTI